MQQILSMGHLISMFGKLSIIMGEVLLTYYVPLICATALGLPT